MDTLLKRRAELLGQLDESFLQIQSSMKELKELSSELGKAIQADLYHAKASHTGNFPNMMTWGKLEERIHQAWKAANAGVFGMEKRPGTMIHGPFGNVTDPGLLSNIKSYVTRGGA